MRISFRLLSLGLAVLAVPGCGSSRPIVGAPSSLSHGDAPVGSVTGQTLTIQNTGNATLVVTSLAITGPDSIQFGFASTPLVPFNLPAGGTASTTIQFRPTSTGLKHAILTIRSNDPVTPNQAVSLSGTAIEPAVGMSPARPSVQPRGSSSSPG